MIETSEDYKTAITDVAETDRFYADFGFIPPGSQDNVIFSNLNFGQFNNFQQINNKKNFMDEKWGSLELNRCVLGDGTEYPRSIETGQIGEWSLIQSDENRMFLEDCYIVYKMKQEYDLIGITVYFDDKGKEFANKFKVEYLDSNNQVIESKMIENDKTLAIIDLPQTGVRSIKISPIIWNYPNRFAKVCKIAPGQIKYFSEDNIFSFELNENISIFKEIEMPYNKLIFDNSSNEYNIINPDALITKLDEGMQLNTQIGIDINSTTEFVNTGKWLLTIWNDEANDETGTFENRPDIQFMGKYNGTGPLTQTLQLAVNRINAISNTKNPIILDSSLAATNLNIFIGMDVDLLTALYQLCIACKGYLKINRDLTYQILPIRTSGISTNRIDFNNMYSIPQVKKGQKITGVKLNYFVEAESRSIEVTTQEKKGVTKDITCNFIRDENQAREIAQFALDFYQRRLMYSINYRGDMSIEAGDIIDVETNYGFKQILVLQNNITYNKTDFLIGNLSGVGL